jgi:hypothetical protein
MDKAQDALNVQAGGTSNNHYALRGLQWNHITMVLLGSKIEAT